MNRFLMAGKRRAGGCPAQPTDTKKDIEILNASLGGEYFGIAAYEAAMGTGLLENGVRDVAEKFQGDHKQHAQRAGSSPASPATTHQAFLAIPGKAFLLF